MTERAPPEEPLSIRPRRWRQSLPVRVAMLLTLAVLPIGLVALMQTWRAISASEETFASALLAHTSAVVAPERRMIFTTVGVARTLADAIGDLDPEADACSALMRSTMRSNPALAFAGYVEEGVSRCNNLGEVVDFSDDPASRALFAEPRPDIHYSAEGGLSGQPAIFVSEPVLSPEGDVRGFVSLSFPTFRLASENTETQLDDDEEATVFTFNSAGKVLSWQSATEIDEEEARAQLPADVSLGALAGSDGTTFTAFNGRGEERLFAVVPILADRAYALGSWSGGARGMNKEALSLGTTVAFPLLMWAVSMVVALVALNQLVLRHIKGLGRRMRGFADGRRIVHSDRMRGAPTEIRDIDRTFEIMARQIIRDEAELENTLHEREVLLREIHHRVKNNLQLMSSIINMQVRQVKSHEARSALRQFQDRVTSLASVHRALYEAPSVNKVRADMLIDDLVSQLAAIGDTAKRGLHIERDLKELTLLPDQAGPLAMLAAEAVVNALKYGDPAEGDAPAVRIGLDVETVEAGKRATLRVENPLAAPPEAAGSSSRGGLGQKLIRAFASQLDAEHGDAWEDGTYLVWFRFLVDDPDRGTDHGT